MNIPTPNKFNPDSSYLRGLVHRSKLAQTEMAWRIGIEARTFRRYLTGESRYAYPVQFAVECVTRAIETEAVTPAQYREMNTRELHVMGSDAKFAMQDLAPASAAYQRAADVLRRVERETKRRSNGHGK